MKNLFGTDGIRGKYGKEITPIMLFNLGCAIANIAKNKNKQPIIIIACDTRKSRFTLLNALKSGLTAYGIKVIDVHIMPTPMLSYLLKLYKFDYGLMLTASHNSEEYNGIKVFNNDGIKINIEEEMKISTEYNNLKNNYNFLDFGIVENKNELKFDYINNLLKLFDFQMKNKKIVIDCANGATIKYAEKIFSKFSANIKFLGENENKGINDNCGVMHIENLMYEMKKGDYEIGFAYDGDGDRLLAVTKNLNILDGDAILYILAKYYKQKKKRDITKVVGTIMSSLSLEIALKNIDINLIRTDVGDKNITRELINKKLLLGAEKSGHIIINDFNSTGDAIFASLKLCELLFKYKINFDAEIENIPNIEVIESNIEIKNELKEKIINDIKFKKFYNEKKKFIKKNNGRLIIRPSGTEPLIRVMIECYNKEISINFINEINGFINNYIIN